MVGIRYKTYKQRLDKVKASDVMVAVFNYFEESVGSILNFQIILVDILICYVTVWQL